MENNNKRKIPYSKNIILNTKEKQLSLSDTIKSLMPKKCEYCGCYDGIHRADCFFMRKLV